jgi:alcohol dehydrogenase
MKSMQLHQYGKASEALQVNNETAVPELKPGQVLVENHTASVNPFDVKLSAGYMKEMIPLQLPVTLGGDFAGVVTQVGEEVTDIQPGDAVYGSANILSGGSGAFAETVTTNAKNIAKKPQNASFEEAAALVLTGVSSIQALEEHIKLQSDQKILIHGGAGGIGSVAIQLAKSIGAHVATTVSTDDKEFVAQLGADEVIDYKNEKFEEQLKEFDAVYDTVGGETAERSFQVLKQGGVLVSMLGEQNPELAKEKGITSIGQSTHITTARLNRLAELVDSGKVKAQIDKTFPLDQVSEAFDIVANVHPRGKVVLKIKE